MKRLMLSTCTLALSSLVLVQMSTEAEARSRTKKRDGGVVTSMQNNTGGRPTRVRSRRATGADTITSNSAAGGTRHSHRRPAAQAEVAQAATCSLRALKKHSFTRPEQSRRTHLAQCSFGRIR
jgi:hypothetical protein